MPDDDPRQRLRRALATPRGAPPITDARVLDAAIAVPRDQLVPAEVRDMAWLDRPLPIGWDVTISQPYIVALMTQLADVQPGERVLEIGTGSGYQAAVLAELGAEVYTVEIIEPLAARATADLARLGYDAVHVRAGDGWAGWPEHAPYDAIVVTAAPEIIPPALLEQLGPGGLLVAPIGPQSDAGQDLRVVERRPDGTLTEQSVIPVRFVPMTGGDAD